MNPRRRKVTRVKKAKIPEILTDSSRASLELHPDNLASAKKQREAMGSELAKLRTRFEGMIARGLVPLLVINSDGFIRQANKAACTLLGYPVEKLVYLSFNYLMERAEVKRFKEFLAHCGADGLQPSSIEMRLRRADGEWLPVQLVCTLLNGRGGDQFEIAAIDQTKLKQRADELRDARDFAESIVQTIQQPLAVMNAGLEVISVNRAFSRVFGVARSSSAKPFFDRLLDLPHKGRLLRQVFRQVLSTREVVEGLFVEVSPNSAAPQITRGSEGRTLLVTARPFFRQANRELLLLVSVEDITRQQQAEQALKREHLMFARAEALAHTGGWEWDIEQDHVIWSDELFKIFGVEQESFTPTYRTYLDLVHPEDRAAVDAIIRKGLNSGAPLDFVHRIDRKDGVRIVHCQGYFAFNAHGHPVTLTGIAQDVTELRKVEEQLREANNDLEDRTRSLQRSNEEMQAFSYSIAHDLRAPLRAIQGMSRILMEDYANTLDQDGQDYFARIMDAAQRMDDLIRDLLDYARMTTVQLPVVPVDTEAIWERVTANFATEIKDKKAIIEREQPLPIVHGHRTVVELAFNNLLGNALKFFAKGTVPHVKVWTERMTEDRIRFFIQDKGIGIAPEHQQRIFRVFERLHPADAYPGTGIGLAIVKKGIERVGGTVGLSSEPGQGSTFWFELSAAK